MLISGKKISRRNDHEWGRRQPTKKLPHTVRPWAKIRAAKIKQIKTELAQRRTRHAQFCWHVFESGPLAAKSAALCGEHCRDQNDSALGTLKSA